MSNNATKTTNEVIDNADNQYMGHRVAQYRQSKGIDINEVAKTLKISPHSLTQIEKGTLKDNQTLLDEADIIGMNRDNLLQIAKESPWAKHPNSGSNDQILEAAEGKHMDKSSLASAPVSSNVKVTHTSRWPASIDNRLFQMAKKTLEDKYGDGITSLAGFRTRIRFKHSHDTAYTPLCNKIGRMAPEAFSSRMHAIGESDSWIASHLEKAGITLTNKSYKTRVYKARIMHGITRSELVEWAGITWNEFDAVQHNLPVTDEIKHKIHHVLSIKHDVRATINQERTHSNKVQKSSDNSAKSRQKRNYAIKQAQRSNNMYRQPSIDKLLAKHGYPTYTKFAAACGITQGNFSRIKNGHSKVTPYYLKMFSQTLHEPVSIVAKAFHASRPVSRIAQAPTAKPNDLRIHTSSFKPSVLVKKETSNNKISKQILHELTDMHQRLKHAANDETIFKSKTNHEIEDLKNKLSKQSAATSNANATINDIADPSQLSKWIDHRIDKKFASQNQLSQEDAALLNGLHKLFSTDPNTKTIISYLINASSPQISAILAMVHVWQHEDDVKKKNKQR